MQNQIPDIDQETQKIIGTYQKLYNLIFKYGVFVIMVIASFIVVLSLNSRSFAADTASINSLNGQLSPLSTVIHSGDIYIAKGVTLAPQIDTQPLTVNILQGFVRVSPEAEMGYAALALHSGLILPMSINLITHDNNYTKEYFSSSGYAPADLDAYIKDTILTYPVKNIQAMLTQYKQNPFQANAAAGKTFGDVDLKTTALAVDNVSLLPANTSLVINFGLQCLGKRHLTNFFCYKNIEQFISRMPYISFDNKLSELSSLMGSIMDSPYKKNACDNLEYAFSKDVSIDRQWEFIFSQCGSQYVQAYHRILDFVTVSYEIQGISNAKLYTDDDINIFKLLSMQQKIYHNTLQKNYDVGTIEAYLSFVQDLLTKKPNIDQIYKDITYVYNNTYLQSALTQIAIVNNNTKAMLKLTDVIKQINEGTVQLQRMISNQSLVSYIDATKGKATSQQNLVTFQDLFANKFTTFDTFVVTNQRVDNDSLSAQVEGYFVVNSYGVEKNTLFVGDYNFQDDNFILSHASFPQNSYLEITLNKLIKQNTTTIDIPFVYEFIKNNINYSASNLSICDIIASKVSPSVCDRSHAIFDQNDTGNAITFNFQGYTITSIVSDNPAITKIFKGRLDGVITTQENIAETVKNLMLLVHPQGKPVTQDDPLTGSSIDNNQFIIISKFQQFLNTTPTKVSINSGKYLVEFRLNDIAFIAAIDINNNYKLFPIAVKVNDTVTRVNNFSLNLTNVSLPEINLFKTDTMSYIKKLDQAAWRAIQPQTP